MNIEELVRSAAQEYGVDPEFALSIARAESNLNPNAVSKRGAIGVMQLMPATAREMGVTKIADPEQNVRGGVAYLAKLHKQFNGDPTLVAAAYNAGPGAVRKAGGVPNFPETQAYVAKVVPQDQAVPEDRLVASEQPVDESRLVTSQPSTKEAQKVMGLERGDLARQLTAGAGFGGAHAADILQGAIDVPAAVAQMVSRGTGTGVDAVESVRKYIADFYSRNFEPDKQLGSALGRGVGQALVTAPLAPAMAPGAGLAKSVATGSAIGGGMGALTPVDNASTDAEFWREKLKQTGAGMAVGGGMDLAGRMLARGLSPAISPAAQLLQKEGVTLTPGMTGGKAANVFESKSTSIPITGDAIRSAREGTLESFNQTLYARILRRFGPDAEDYARKLPVGNEGIAKVGDALSGAYEGTLAKMVPSPFNPTPINTLQTLLPQRVRGDFGDIVKREVLDRVTPAGTLTPSAFKDAESGLGREIRTYMGSSDAMERQVGRALRQTQAELRAMAAAANPQQAPFLQKINAAWADLVQLETAGSKIGSKEGVVTPATFRNAVKASDFSGHDRAFSRGQARNQAFADAADKIIPSQYPDSGTAGRWAQQNTGALLTGVITSPAAIPYLPGIRNLMTNRPQALVSAGNALREASPYLAAPVGGLLGLFP